MRQLERYSEHLGDEAPKSLAEFQALKYERPDDRNGVINTAFSNKDFDAKTKAILEVFK